MSIKSRVCALFTAVAALGVPLSAAAAPQVFNGDLSGVNNFTGDVIVTGSVKKDARVNIKDGGLVVRGNLEDNAVVLQKDSRSPKDGPHATSSVSITGSASVTLNGVSVGVPTKKDGLLYGVTIEGNAEGASAISAIGSAIVRGKQSSSMFMVTRNGGSCSSVGSSSTASKFGIKGCF